MKRWLVVTPEYGEVVAVTDEGQGPMEYQSDVVEVEAETRRDAIAVGVKLMLRGGPLLYGYGAYRWCREQRLDGCNPYAGVTAESYDDSE